MHPSYANPRRRQFLNSPTIHRQTEPSRLLATNQCAKDEVPAFCESPNISRSTAARMSGWPRVRSQVHKLRWATDDTITNRRLRSYKNNRYLLHQRSQYTTVGMQKLWKFQPSPTVRVSTSIAKN